MCRQYQRRCTRRAQKDTTDTVRPTCLTSAGARSAVPSLPFSLPHKHNASGRANKHVPKIAMDMNEMTDDTNGPKLVIHDSSSDGVWAVFTKMEGDRAHVKNKVANIIRSLGYSIIKSDQAPVIRSMERKVVESLHEDDFGEFCCCQVVMLHSPVGESAANGVIENAIRRVQGQVRAIKLDIETNIKAKLNPSQTIWLWPIEYAAQTFLFWRTSGDDGLTAIQTENQEKIHHSAEAQMRRRNHIQDTEGRQAQQVRSQVEMWSVDWIHQKHQTNTQLVLRWVLSRHGL